MIKIGVRGFPLWGYLIPERNGTGAWTPWKFFSARRRRRRRPWSMAGMDKPNTNAPTYQRTSLLPMYQRTYQRTNVPTYQPIQMHL